MKASEDFNEFGTEAKSCFFFYGIGTKSGRTLHSPDYNFNDDCLEKMAHLWMRIIKLRLLQEKN